MKRIIAFATVTVLLAACGAGGASSGGSLTVPAADTSVPDTTDTTIADDSTTTSTAAGPSTTAPNTTSTTVADEAEVATVTVYFLDDAGRAVAVDRTVEGPGVAAAAVEALIAGPHSSDTGLSTAFPADSLLLGLRIDGSTAVVDMSVEFESGGGSAAVLGRLAQLVYTLTEFDNVDRVRLLLDGEEVEHFSGEGVFVGEELSRADFTGSIPIGSERPQASAPIWDQDDLDVPASGTDVFRVVLVAADDYLNVRRTAGVEADVIGRLLPGVAVRSTGGTTTAGSSTWREIRTPAGNGWVNGFYLTPSTPSVGDPEFEEDALDVIAELSERFAADAAFGDLVSSRGLFVAHHAFPIRFDQEELVGILADPTTYRWGSNALEPGSPEIQPRTFARAVAERFTGAYDDSDRSLLIGESVEGPNGRPPQFALPTEFTGFPFVTIFDPGDDPQYGGLDWTSWAVSFAYEGGEPRVVGLTLDEWSP
ncbi:MAG TPA: GerMN domain-containing protein [Acidimicrobiia bacterium]|nr:GerMN domain-containing protein [Acidimicrobiia bacterium]